MITGMPQTPQAPDDLAAIVARLVRGRQASRETIVQTALTRMGQETFVGA